MTSDAQTFLGALALIAFACWLTWLTAGANR